jgi:hypothetical protein
VSRSMIVVIALAGVSGLALGWVAFGGRTAVPDTLTHHTLKPTAEGPPPEPSAIDPARREFPLRSEDIANDRETPALAVDSDGRVVLAWAAQSGDLERTLYLARSADGGKNFDPPAPFRKVPIYRFSSQGKGKSGTMNFSTHVLPRLVATADGFYLGWVEAVDGSAKVLYQVARSSDGGKTFSAPFTVPGAGAKKPGFTTLTAAPDGTLLAAWLDGRNQGPQPFFTDKPPQSEGFEADRIVFAGPDGKGICPCCDLATARLPDGSDLVAFRNNDGGHRDIWFARARKGAAFGPPTPLSLDKWTFEGCPHDGPSLAVDGDRLHAAWMSAHSGKNRVYVASTAASELAFVARELSPATPGAQGHPRLAATGAGKIHAVWDESLDAAGPAPSKSSHSASHGPTLSGSGRAIMLASSREAGFDPASPVSPRPGAFQLNPAIAIGPDGAILVAWSEIDTIGKRIVFVRRDPAKGSR